MRNCIIAVFCSYVNRLRQYCCIIRKNGARPWLLVGKGRRRDAGNGKQRSRLHSRLSQSLRRSYNRLGNPQLLRRLWEKRAFCSRPANRRGANTLQLASLCGKTAACQRSRFIRSPAQNGFARLLQKAAEARNKARAGSVEGRKNARKEAQDGAASRRSKEYGALCALLFARLLYDSLRLCRAAKPRHRFSAPPRASRAARRPARAAGQPLPPNRRQRLCNFVQRERARVQWVSIPQIVPRCLPPAFAEYETDWKNRFSKKGRFLHIL